MDTGALVRTFWARMTTNDWAFVAQLFAHGFVLDMPQTGERLKGGRDFVAMNASYPAQGVWKFEVLRLLISNADAVTETRVTDGARVDTVISFIATADGEIAHIVEYWPEAAPVPEWRKGRFGARDNFAFQPRLRS